ncbi:hypothetical protein M422DRAFT_35961 [Sphaerobolus stellatus SS14]|uniref:Uncharacterized protein n=1 Tax=Sphaerobolus stellatus (strain SS14) TaxID=990650 RepID=A0A0C9V3Y1_SPHS4|nr:hypothetical protein M422DRAFT_35961 [Sphaerobolus stellatus SS14]
MQPASNHGNKRLIRLVLLDCRDRVYLLLFGIVLSLDLDVLSSLFLLRLFFCVLPQRV